MNVNVIQTLEDPRLLGQFIRDPETWRAWMAFLRAFFALKASEGDREIFLRCTGRSRWPRDAAKEAWLIIGTRGGKSFVTALVATYLAVFRRYRLAPGERGFVIIVAPTKRQSAIVKRYLSSFFHDNLFLKPYLARETTEEMELRNEVIISVLSSDYRSLRGYTAIAAIVDEVAFLDIEGSRPDVEVVRALRSRLLTTRGPLICISSPHAKRGALYGTYRRHFGAEGSPILVWQAPSLLMNPTLDAGAIAHACEEDPEAARADYEARFRSDVESYVRREALEACVVPGRYELPPIPGVRYGAFVDPSGGSRDSMTLAVTHREGGMRVLDAVREARAPFSPDGVVREFSELLARYRISGVTGDRYGGEWPRERFARHGVTYGVSERAKSEIYREFLPLINCGEVELLEHGGLLGQIANLERRTARGGRDSVDHPPGGHDDLANAAAGALIGGPPPVRVGVW